MSAIRVFISSVQTEFAEEREALREFLRGDMIKRCRNIGLNIGLDKPELAFTDGFVVTIRRKPELAFEAGITGVVTGEVTGEVQRLLTVLVGEMKRTDIQEALALRHEDYFREAYLMRALTAGIIEMTIPGKRTSSKQKYRLTPQGRTSSRNWRRRGTPGRRGLSRTGERRGAFYV